VISCLLEIERRLGFAPLLPVGGGLATGLGPSLFRWPVLFNCFCDIRISASGLSGEGPRPRAGMEQVLLVDG
jgi:hypothetical protein